MIPEHLAVLGRVTRPHGLKGALKVRLAEGIIPQIGIEEPVFILLQGGPVPFFVAERPHVNGGSLVLKLEGIDTIEAAEKFTGKEIHIAPEKLLTEEKTGLHVLVGYAVTDVNLGSIGAVSGVMELPYQSVLEVEHRGKQLLIPAIEPIIRAIDAKGKRLTVETPEGLVDLYING